MSEKYGRTPHLPWSPGGTSDDRRLGSVDHLLNTHVVLTEKLDGSNFCMTREGVFARSHSGAPKHPSFDMAKQVHAGISHAIPVGLSVFGEWCFAVHSIPYTQLPGYFCIFGVRDDNTGDWWSWDMVSYLASELGVPTVPVLFEGIFTSAKDLQTVVEGLAALSSACGGDREGIVVRLASGYSSLEHGLAKHVRKDHVQTTEHWSHQAVKRNTLA